jgi:hypothetical protein
MYWFVPRPHVATMDEIWLTTRELKSQDNLYFDAEDTYEHNCKGEGNVGVLFGSFVIDLETKHPTLVPSIIQCFNVRELPLLQE